MFLFRSAFVIAMILASSSGVMARTFVPSDCYWLSLTSIPIVFVPLWHYAMIAEGPDGALSTVSVIDATGTAPPCPMVTPTTPTSSLADISATPTVMLPVEQATVIDAQDPQASDTVSNRLHRRLNLLNRRTDRTIHNPRLPFPGRTGAYALCFVDLVS